MTKYGGKPRTEIPRSSVQLMTKRFHGSFARSEKLRFRIENKTADELTT